MWLVLGCGRVISFLPLSADFLFGVADTRCPLLVLSAVVPPGPGQLGPEGLAEDKVNEGVQADVECGHHDGQLL